MTFQKDIHIFRAIAIMFIVGGHSRLLLDWSEHRELGYFLADLLSNGTLLFVFISGYLFQALSHTYSYPSYVQTKLKNVVLPYLLVSSPAVILAIFYYGAIGDYPALAGHGPVYQAFWFFIKGGAHINFPLWFIPMISLFFLLAPVFILFVRWPHLYILLVPFAIVSVLVHRAPMPHLDTAQLLLYFVAPYLAGMCTSQFRDQINKVIGGRLGVLLAVYIIVLSLHYLLASKHGVHAAESWFSTEEGVFDWPFLQKMVFCYVLLEFGRRYQHVLFDKLKYVADTSFGIYFMHAYFLKLLAIFVPEQLLKGGFVSFIVVFSLVMACCLATCYLMQRIFGRYSRRVIGC